MTNRKNGVVGQCRGSGFTLVELLIVIAIIGILAGLALRAVSTVRESTDKALTQSDITAIQNALEQYLQDEGDFPAQGKSTKRDTNHFPALFNALYGERRPDGPGGRNAPYIQFKREKIVVWSDDNDQWEEAKNSQIYDEDVDKYIIDAYGEPLVYRCNKGRKYRDFMQNRYGADIYSKGPDGVDQTSEGSDEDNDDIGNW